MSVAQYDKVALLLPMDGANNGTVFTDWSPSPKTPTVAGDAKTSTAQSLYYGSSGLFDGNGDYLSFANHVDFRPGADDFGVGCRVRFSTLPSAQQIIAGIYNAAPNRRSWAVTFQPGGKLGFVYSNAGTDVTVLESPPHGIPTDQWVWVWICRHGSLARFFVEGDELGSGASVSGSIYNNTVDPLVVCALQAPSYTSFFNGHMQDLVFVKGSASLDGSFSAPGRLVGEISGPVTDEEGDPAERRIVVFPRAVPARVFQTVSDGSGAYSLRVPATECSRIVLAEDAGSPGPGDPVLPDLIHRIIPQ